MSTFFEPRKKYHASGGKQTRIDGLIDGQSPSVVASPGIIISYKWDISFDLVDLTKKGL